MNENEFRTWGNGETNWHGYNSYNASRGLSFKEMLELKKLHSQGKSALELGCIFNRSTSYIYALIRKLKLENSEK